MAARDVVGGAASCSSDIAASQASARKDDYWHVECFTTLLTLVQSAQTAKLEALSSVAPVSHVAAYMHF